MTTKTKQWRVTVTKVEYSRGTVVVEAVSKLAARAMAEDTASYEPSKVSWEKGYGYAHNELHLDVEETVRYFSRKELT